MVQNTYFLAAAAMTAALLSSGFAQEVDKASDAPMIEPWGYPLNALDRNTRPGDDFYRFANGGWLDATEISPDRTAVGFSITMRERNEGWIYSILSELATARVSRGSEAQKIRDIYRSFIDVGRIDKLGLKPIKKDLARMAALKNHNQIARAMADPALGLKGPFMFYVGIDSKNPVRYATWVGHDGLGLPDKSYYERDDERLASVRKAYRNHIEHMLTLAGIGGASEKADTVFDLEKKIAALHWERAERRDADRVYNLMDRATLADFAPGFPWGAYLDAAGLGGVEALIVREKDAFPALATLFAETPVDTWSAYLTYHLLSAHGRFLPNYFEQEYFAFYGAVLNGQKEQRTREKRAIVLVNEQLDHAIGKIYVERFFSEQSKHQLIILFENVRAALRTRIKTLAWMTPDTKTAALGKLEKMTAKIAYPEKWRDYSKLKIKANDLIGNIKRIRVDSALRDIARLSKPVDKAEWFTGPQTVNAYYSASRNEVFIPAGYIQSPLFDPHADPALNYGAIGSIIGHEIGHGFDDQGSKYDGDGVLGAWWTREDRAAFNALGDRLADQFSQYEPLPGVNVNGRATLGENIGDLAGVTIAYHAYLLSLDGAEPPVLDGFTGRQRVFLGRAQGRRFKQTEEGLRRRLISGQHSPMDLRVNGVVRNIDEWYEAFDIQPGDAMYLAPEDRVRIW
jgi:putative endopeptidase